MATRARWDLLPAFMAVRKRPEFLGGEVYSSTEGIRVLGEAESRAAHSRALGGLPAANAVEIDWSGLPHRAVEAGDPAAAVAALREALAPAIARDRRVLVLWALDLCVELDAALLGEHMDAVEAATPDLMVFVPADGLLIDRRFDGRIVVAQRPSR